MEQNPNSPPSEPQKSLIGFPNFSWPPSHLHNYHHHQHHQSSWPQEPPPSMFPNKNPSPSFNFKHEDIIEGDDDQDVVQEHQQQEVALGRQQRLLDKEPMFEKPLTPSDVGKLNRLVIPKQHAEKYFPLGGDSADKGLLLSFEDESGKSWRFRYSYWNSSQSYVLTKGWSRYVKEKQLDAGDVVLFERHRTDGDRLFIGWRRRSDSSSTSSSTTGMAVQGNSSGVWSRGLHYSSSSSGHQQQPYPSSSTTLQYGDGANIVAPTCVPYQPDCLHAGSVPQNQTAITTAGNSKRRLRLFGVNLECQLDESEPSTPDGSSMSSSEQGPTNQQNLYFQSAYSSDSHNQMDITFSKDVSQTRNRRG